MKLRCSTCCHEIELAGGTPPPPWCRSCGSDFKPLQFDAAESRRPHNLGAGEAELVISRTRPDDATLFQCGGCGWKTSVPAGGALPPWCAHCGEDVRPDSRDTTACPAQSNEDCSSPVDPGSSLHEVPLPEVLQPYVGPSVASDQIGNSSANLGNDERFASHNLLVGPVLAL